MPKFGQKSRANLFTTDRRLQWIGNQIIKFYDISCLEGHRGRDLQDKYVREGLSKVEWPHSKHNAVPSLAVHFAPYNKRIKGILWDDRESFVFLAGLVIGLGAARGWRIRWGGDWDMDGDLKDQTFNDLAHFELLK